MVAYDDDEALSPVPMLSAPATAAPISESRRQALREIELKVVKYQDDLEACRKKGDSSVSDEAIAKVRWLCSNFYQISDAHKSTHTGVLHN